MSTVLILLVLAVLVVLGPVIYFLFRAVTKGTPGPRYQGEAPHQGPVMRFTGTSSEVKQDSGKQTTNRV
jgi:hypothetical protein